MINPKPYWRIMKTAAKEKGSNPKALIASLALSLFRIFLLSAIYEVAYQYGKAGLTYQNAIWSLAIYYIFIMSLNIRGTYRTIELEIQNGEVELQLIKPLDWRLAKVCAALGGNGLDFLIQTLVLPIFLYFLVGAPNVGFWTASFLLCFILLLFLAVASANCLFMIIGLSTFWLNDSSSLFRLFDKMVIIFGGAFVPLALLPNAIQYFVRYSPFGVYASPTQIFNPHIAGALPSYLISALIWTLLLFYVNQQIWKRAQNRIEVNGG